MNSVEDTSKMSEFLSNLIEVYSKIKSLESEMSEQCTECKSATATYVGFHKNDNGRVFCQKCKVQKNEQNEDRNKKIFKIRDLTEKIDIKNLNKEVAALQKSIKKYSKKRNKLIKKFEGKSPRRSSA